MLGFSLVIPVFTKKEDDSEEFIPEIAGADVGDNWWVYNEKSSHTVFQAPDFNWPKFWNVFKNHALWKLQYDVGDGWIDATPDQYEIGIKQVENKQKLWLNFTTHPTKTGDYRLILGVDYAVKNFANRSGLYEYTLTYEAWGEQFNVTFDWSDMADISGIIFNSGVGEYQDHEGFWFSVRKNNIPPATPISLDPEYNVYSGANTVTVFPNARRFARQSNGTLWCAFEESDDVHVAWSEDSGATWTDREIWGAHTSNIPSIAVDSNDIVHLVWYGYSTLDADDYHIRYCNTSDLSDIANISYIANQDYLTPAIAVDSSDNLHIVYERDDAADSEAHYLNSTDNGVTWSDVIVLTSETEADDDSFRPSIAISSTDSLHVIFAVEDYGGTTDAIFHMYSSDTGVTWSGWTDDVVLQTIVNEFMGTLVINDDDDLIAIGYDGNNNVFYRINVSGSNKWVDGDVDEEIDLDGAFPTSSVSGNDSIYCIYEQESDDDVYLLANFTETNNWDSDSILMLGTYLGPNAISAQHPTIDGAKTNRPATGYAFIVENGTGIITYNCSDDLTWETASVGAEWTAIEDWNGSLYNITEFQDTENWNGSIYNATHSWQQIEMWNGSIYNITARNIQNFNDGTFWYTINEAIENATAGDQIYCNATTYYENVIIDKPITLLGAGVGNTSINGSLAESTINITSNGVNVSNFTVTYGSPSGICIGASDYSTIENCSVSDNAIYGLGHILNVGTNSFDYSIVRNCNVSENGDITASGYNVFIDKGDYVNLNNVTANSVITADTPPDHGYGFYLKDSNYFIISDCDAHIDYTDPAVAAPDETLNYLNDCDGGNISYGNFSGGWQYGWILQYSDRVDFHMNTFEHDEWGIYLDSVSAVNITYNTFINCSTNGGIYRTGDGNTIFHNNFYNTTNSDPGATGIWYNLSRREGNYYNNYDNLSDGAVDNNSNGRADTPYLLPGGGSSRDYYPLMTPWDGTPLDPFYEFKEAWNGSLYNISSFQQIEMWNGSIYNASVPEFTQIEIWNGSLYNISSSTLIEIWNGSLYNATHIWIETESWNGSLYNISSTQLIEGWNGTIYNISSSTLIETWNGSLYNISTSLSVETWNGSLYNISSSQAIETWNGSLYNITVSGWTLMESFNGSLYNISTSRSIESWNGSLYNDTFSWISIESWNGSLYNASAREWQSVETFNGSIYNISTSLNIESWNGSLYNISSATIIESWNGSLVNLTHSFQLIEAWNGTIYNISSYINIESWNGSLYNVSESDLIEIWNGSLLGIPAFVVHESWNGTIYNASEPDAIHYVTNKETNYIYLPISFIVIMVLVGAFLITRRKKEDDET